MTASSASGGPRGTASCCRRMWSLWTGGRGGFGGCGGCGGCSDFSCFLLFLLNSFVFQFIIFHFTKGFLLPIKIMFQPL